MSIPIDYYLSLASPWSYLGHKRLTKIASEYGRQINIHPIDLSLVLPATGVYRFRKDPSSERLSYAGVKTVARLPEFAFKL